MTRPGRGGVARVVRSADFVADLRTTLGISEENWGRDGRVRYALLIERALVDLAGDPGRTGVREVPGAADAFGYHLRHSRNGVPAGQRVGRPRHAVFFRLDDRGTVLHLLRLLHDRMLPDPWLPPPDDAL